MPAYVRKHSKAHKVDSKHFGNPHWHVVSPEKGVVGHSTSQKRAKASAGIRTRAARKPKRGKCK